MRKVLKAGAVFAASAAMALLTATAASASTHQQHYFTPSGGTPIATNANCLPSSTPVPADNCGMAGYMGSGRDFRFSQALITIPNHDGSLGSFFTAPDPVLYAALDNSGSQTWQYTRVGIAPCPASHFTFIVPGDALVCPSVAAGNTSGWVVFAATADEGSPVLKDVDPIASSSEGDGVLVNEYLTPGGNSVLTTITMPDGSTHNNTFAVTGPVYKRAIAAADWSTARENNPLTHPAPRVPADEKVRDSSFLQGRFTTVSGAAGTFKGPWTLNALEATSNGILPPGGTLIGQPSYLWTDGNSYKGMFGDAFGVWRFPF